MSPDVGRASARLTRLQASLLPANVAPAALRLARREAPAAAAAAGAILGGVHAESAAAELVAVELLDRLGRILIGCELDEGEAARAAALAVHRKKHIADLADLREQ